jgi:fibrillarin-like rRNA methylase
MSVDVDEKRVAEKADAAAIQEANDKLAADKSTPLGQRVWNAAWPKLLAVAIVIGIWQLLYELEWRPAYLFASPGETFSRLGDLMTGDVPNVNFWAASPRRCSAGSRASWRRWSSAPCSAWPSRSGACCARPSGR